MADDFPSEYDAIILGTGLPESVIAAALARVGKTVLHLDRNDYYSSQWATFTFDGQLNWIKANQELDHSIENSDSTASPPCNDGEKIQPLLERPTTVTNVVTRSYMRTKRKEAEPSETKASSLSENDAEKGKEESHTLEYGQTEKEDSAGDQQDLEQDENREAVATSEHNATDESNISDKTDEAPTSEPDAAVETTVSSQSDGDIETGEGIAVETTVSSQSDGDIETGEGIAVETTVSSQSDGDIETGEGIAVETTQPLEMPPRPRFSSPKPPINKDMTYEDLEKYSRQFNIDLAPKLLYSRGPLVEAIISANISHYAEFKAVNRILTYLNGNIEDVPCSRSDVFSSKLISAIEKRTLMKFLTFCIDFENHEDEYREFMDKPFVEFLQSRRMTPNLRHFVVHAIAMLPPETATLAALKATRSFLQSLGRYGNTPFIWPLYGIGELPQAFCRMCAVFGGLYCLRRSADSVTVDISSNTCTGVTSDGQFLKCKWLIMEQSYLPKQWNKETTKFVSRAVFVTDKSVKASEHGAVLLMSMPKTHDGGSPITVIELDKSTAACPSGLHVIHLVTESCGSAVDDLQATAEELLYFPQSDDDRESSKPVVLWSLYFNHAAPDQSCVDASLPSNIHCTSLPGSSLGFSHAMNQAKQIFQNICGTDEEFLPAIPNPEDIIMDDLAPEQQGNHSSLVGGAVSRQDDDNPLDPLSEEPASANEESDHGNTDTATLAATSNDGISDNSSSDAGGGMDEQPEV